MTIPNAPTDGKTSNLGRAENEVGELREKVNLVEGGLELLLAAVKASDPQCEIIWRIEEELRQLRR